MFADDTNLLFADRNLKSFETVVNMKLTNVYDWLASNKLSLNVKKTNFVIFHPSQKRLNYKVNLKIYDNNRKHFISLESKDYVKYLGVLIDTFFFKLISVSIKMSFKQLEIHSQLLCGCDSKNETLALPI